MSEVNFFVPKGPFYLNELCESKDKIKIFDIKTLDQASQKDITFFNSLDYKSHAKKTKASACVTTENLQQYLPDNCIKILVKNVLFSIAKISKKLYPDADVDYYDKTLVNTSTISSKFNSVIFGKNSFIGKNVKIGSNTSIGINTIIEHDVHIGKNCLIGSNVVIRNSIIGNDIVIQDGCKIGLKGFGFVPLKNKNGYFLRCLLPDELKQIQGFPLDYEILGNKKQKIVQIGNAVPPILIKKIVQTIIG